MFPQILNPIIQYKDSFETTLETFFGSVRNDLLFQKKLHIELLQLIGL
jgi:hypothetical protein